ncbi:MAG TPA: hypothetical protein DIT07_14335 [Sphingobacteriaceae bacterium]|nr:hypothetical protein [Sphingobacteriaceae bacterium]
MDYFGRFYFDTSINQYLVYSQKFPDMKKRISASFKLLLIGVLFSFTTIAQKFPNVQEKSMRAPANIKVDGKTTEWSNQFQAYNKATEIFYTISNDNDKLYLTVKTTDLDIANKIISAGLTFTINGSGKMKDQDGMTVTFPVLDRLKFPSQLPPVDLDNQGKYKDPKVPFITALNKDLNSQAKDIKVTGIKEIQDPIISIYNPYGIKVATLFDEEKAFIYELSIPFKYLGLSIAESKPVVYNIKLNGIILDPRMPVGLDKVSATSHLRPYLRKGIKPRVVDLANYIYAIEGPTGDIATSLISPTNFWGEYIFAK